MGWGEGREGLHFKIILGHASMEKGLIWGFVAYEDARVARARSCARSARKDHERAQACARSEGELFFYKIS